MESPATEADLMAFLQDLGIETETVRHEPVFTVEEAQEHRGELAGGHCKCLFVRDKKKRRALIVVDENRRVDLAGLAEQTGLGRLSFGSADSLKAMLGVVPGSVTPFALVNARVTDGGEPPLMVVLDAAMLGHALLHYHPLHNAATTAIAPDDLLRFIRACGYEPLIVDMDA
ncbi:prolyl-tRNA synthetase associated domain-containing protein [Kordiimonas marina]|uniref:prolyl-tRNA synthetase associated domain-containing protein n=1 Tax=Kordiimonas marina TaxID=2872312 RepID=UPI001FF6DA71|nr:prolyl-tRNA synthetase associated domain-containing protein [Kordiimonas marina]MCJ9428166.1 prolyl-tRNA synthetase associated domain-containing protein [Kordiimonas marina]